MNKTLLDRYKIGEVIGSGGMGTVVSADDDVLGRKVAIKLLKDEFATDAATAERFRREARIAASLSHHGIAQVYDFAEQDETAFIVMELLDGKDLHRSLAEEGAFEELRAAGIVAQAAEALHHAHEQGAIHRDVKPGNIFLTSVGNVKVTDFGIARAADLAPVTRTGDVVGTPYYLAPELVDGKQATSQSDIYALGCVLFELITGEPPYKAESSVAVAMAHKTEPVPDLSARAPEADPDLGIIVSKAMAKEPSDRYSSADEMAQHLNRHIASRQGTATAMAMPTLADAPGETKELRTRSPEGRGGSKMRPIMAVVALALAIFGIVSLGGVVRGDGKVAVPDLTGMRYADAVDRAEDAGLKVARQPMVSFEPRETVVGQEPAKDVRITEGSTVTLLVSDGAGIRVPNVKGSSREQAEAVIRSAGLEPQVVATAEGPTEGVVLDQTPPPGTSAAPGGVVGLTISTEPEERRGKGKGKDDD